MSTNVKNYKPAQDYGGLIRSPAKSLAVGLSFFLAACSSSAVRVSNDAAVPTNKSAQAIQPVTLTATNVNDIVRGGDLPLAQFSRVALELSVPVSHKLSHADVAFGQPAWVLSWDGRWSGRLTVPAPQHISYHASAFTRPLFSTLALPYPHEWRLALAPRGVVSDWHLSTLRGDALQTFSVSSPCGSEEHFQVRRDTARQLYVLEPMLGVIQDSGRLRLVKLGIDFSAIGAVLDQRIHISLNSPATLSGSPPSRPDALAV